VRNHLLGICSEVESLFRPVDVTDQVLEARVRSKLGRVVSHPRAIEVKALEGEVILTGPILSNEEHPLLDAVAGIQGVKNIQNCLELHEEAGEIPALQGGRPRQGERFGILKTNWSPTSKLLATFCRAFGAALNNLFADATHNLIDGILIEASR